MTPEQGADRQAGRRAPQYRWRWLLILMVQVGFGLGLTSCNWLFSDKDSSPTAEATNPGESAPADTVPPAASAPATNPDGTIAGDRAASPNQSAAPPAVPNLPNADGTYLGDGTLPAPTATPPPTAPGAGTSPDAFPADIGVDIAPPTDPTTDINPATMQSVSQAGCCQLDIPSDWQRERGLHAEAELQVSNQAERLYLVVLMDPKQGQHESSLRVQSAAYQAQFLDSLRQDPVVTTMPIQQINGYSAVQGKMDVWYGEVSVTYLHTTVETQRAYYQILAWTTRGQFSFYQQELEQIIQSFLPFV